MAWGGLVKGGTRPGRRKGWRIGLASNTASLMVDPSLEGSGLWTVPCGPGASDILPGFSSRPGVQWTEFATTTGRSDGGPMELIRIAKRPAVSTHSRATIRAVCQSLVKEKVGALAVIDEGKLVGIISERDIVTRVVAPGLDPYRTTVSGIMNKSGSTVALTTSNR